MKYEFRKMSDTEWREVYQVDLYESYEWSGIGVYHDGGRWALLEQSGCSCNMYEFDASSLQVFSSKAELIKAFDKATIESYHGTEAEHIEARASLRKHMKAYASRSLK